MDSGQPLNLLPQTPVSPYSAPNNPYQQMGVGNVVKALQAGLNGAQNSQSAQAPQQAGTPAASTAPNFGQGAGQAVNHLANIAQALGGSSPAFGGGNLFSGDAWGGSAAMPLPGLDASDYG